MRIIVFHLASFVLAGILFAQNTTDLVVHIEVNLVQVDAVVTDKNNRHVTNLTAADFEIRQDGKVQAVTNFSFIDAVPGRRPSVAASPQVKLAPLPAPVDIRAADVRRTFAVVVDDLGLAWVNLNYVKAALRKFVLEERQPRDLVAVIPTGGGMGALQQFTNDPKVLLSAVDHLKFNSIFSRVGIDSFRTVDPFGNRPNYVKNAVSRNQTFQSLQAVIRGLRDLPGRKMLLLISESMQISDDNFIREIADAANRASVVIYTIDPRGIPTLQITAADNTSRMPPPRISQIPFERSDFYFNSQSGLDYMAKETGGLFFHDNNDLGAAVSNMNIDSAGYYLIGYHPDSKTFTRPSQQTTFHKLEVRLKRPDLSVRSRTGFFSVASEPKDLSRRRLRSTTSQGQIGEAFESPFASEAIHVNLAAFFADTKLQGSQIGALLNVDARDLKFSDGPDGVYRAEMQLVFMLDGGKKEKPAFHSETVTLQLKPDRYQIALRNGIASTRYIPVPQPGPYSVKVVLRDNNAETVGSASQFVEVPDLKSGALTLSGIVINGVHDDSLRGSSAETGVKDYDSGLNPAVRIFPRGGTIFFAYQIINARANTQNLPDLLIETRLFRDGKEIYDSTPVPVDASNGHRSDGCWEVDHQLKRGPHMDPGEYVLQAVVTDRLAPTKRGSAIQSTNFEIRAN
jgi:VWFA-related protein